MDDSSTLPHEANSEATEAAEQTALLEMIRDLPEEAFAEICALFGQDRRGDFDDADALKARVSGTAALECDFAGLHNCSIEAKDYLHHARDIFRIAGDPNENWTVNSNPMLCPTIAPVCIHHVKPRDVDMRSERWDEFTEVISRCENSGYVILEVRNGNAWSTAYVEKRALEVFGSNSGKATGHVIDACAAQARPGKKIALGLRDELGGA